MQFLGPEEEHEMDAVHILGTFTGRSCDTVCCFEQERREIANGKYNPFFIPRAGCCVFYDLFVISNISQGRLVRLIIDRYSLVILLVLRAVRRDDHVRVARSCSPLCRISVTHRGFFPVSISFAEVECWSPRR